MQPIPLPEFCAPFIVETSFRLPGLGLLVLPEAPEPSWLALYDLHTALAITLPPSTQYPQHIIGTVEEVAQDGQSERRALLLDFDPATPLAPGTRLQASKTPSELL